MALLYERLGIKREAIDPERSIELFDIPLGIGMRKGDEWMYKETLAEYPSNIALGFYLVEDLEQCIRYARDAVAGTKDYFFGDWLILPNREGKIDPEDRKQSNPWIEYYREGVFWGACLGDWDSVKRLSEYPAEAGKDIISDFKSNESYYRLLASVLAGNGGASDDFLNAPHAEAEEVDPSVPPSPEQLSADEDQRRQAVKEILAGQVKAGVQRYAKLPPRVTLEELIERGSKKRVRLLSACLRAIVQHDLAAFSIAIHEYLKHYKKYEFPRDDVNEKVCIDGSTLIHMAEYAGLPVEIKDAYKDYIVRLPQA